MITEAGQKGGATILVKETENINISLSFEAEKKFASLTVASVR